MRKRPTFADEATQTLRIGAGGLPGSTVEARSCVNVNAVETRVGRGHAAAVQPESRGRASHFPALRTGDAL